MGGRNEPNKQQTRKRQRNEGERKRERGESSLIHSFNIHSVAAAALLWTISTPQPVQYMCVCVEYVNAENEVINIAFVINQAPAAVAAAVDVLKGGRKNYGTTTISSQLRSNQSISVDTRAPNKSKNY